MKKEMIKYSAFGMFIALSLVLFGCKQEGIKFYRESKVSEVMNKFNNNDAKSKKGVLKKSSGVIIYKDTSSNSNSGGMYFGPGDVDFMPIKMK